MAEYRMVKGEKVIVVDTIDAKVRLEHDGFRGEALEPAKAPKLPKFTASTDDK